MATACGTPGTGFIGIPGFLILVMSERRAGKQMRREGKKEMVFGKWKQAS